MKFLQRIDPFLCAVTRLMEVSLIEATSECWWLFFYFYKKLCKTKRALCCALLVQMRGWNQTWPTSSFDCLLCLQWMVRDSVRIFPLMTQQPQCSSASTSAVTRPRCVALQEARWSTRGRWTQSSCMIIPSSTPCFSTTDPNLQKAVDWIEFEHSSALNPSSVSVVQWCLLYLKRAIVVYGSRFCIEVFCLREKCMYDA